MSFLGVGAPEAIMVAVVALVVFGPKGLAEVRLQDVTTMQAVLQQIHSSISFMLSNRLQRAWARH